MQIRRVDHYAIRTGDLARSHRFYTEVIGLKEGPRPPFDFPGYWLYGGEPPAALGSADNGIVHLMGYNRERPGSLDAHVGERGTPAGGGTGALDHVAFAATGREAMLERCRAHDVRYTERVVPLLGVHQVFLKDPDGVTIELNYALEKSAVAE